MSRFLKDTSKNLAGQLVTMLFGLANGIILARWLGPEGRGILAAAALIPQLLIALLAGGFGTSIVYFVASRLWSREVTIPRVMGINSYLTALSLFIGLLSVAVGHSWFIDVPKNLLYLGLTTIPLMLAAQSFTCLLQGEQAFGQLLKYRSIAAVALVIATVVALFLSGGTVMGALLGRIAGTLIGVSLLIWIVASNHTSSRWWPALAFSELKPALSYGGRAHAANAISFLNYRADQFLITSMINPQALGIYTVAVTWAEMLWMVAGNMSSVLLPRLASAEDNQRGAEFTARLARVMLIFIVFTTVGFGLIAAPVIPWLYSAAFRGAVLALLALLPGIMAMGYTKILANYMAAVGKPEINAKNAAIGLAVNILANVILIPKHGIVGASIATSISYGSISFLCYRDFVRLTNLPWSAPLVAGMDDWRLVKGLAKKILQSILGRLRTTK